MSVPLSQILNTQPPALGALNGLVPGKESGAKGAQAWQGKEFGFADILDTINPLQHIPLVNNLYRAITGDEIGSAAKAAGGSLFGGIPGLIGSIVDTVVEEISGKDINEHIATLFDENGQIDEDIAENSGTDEGTNIAANVIAGPQQFVQHAPKLPTKMPHAIQTPALKDLSPAATDQHMQNLISTLKKQASGDSIETLKGNISGKGNSFLPPARALAANPGLMHSMKSGNSPYFRPGGNINNNAWVKIMHNARSDKQIPTAPVSGPKGLAAQVMAKAATAYGDGAKLRGEIAGAASNGAALGTPAGIPAGLISTGLRR
jgi:hypothetical protein